MNKNEVNIKVNVKTSIFNNIDKNNKNKGLFSKFINQSQKKLINDKNSSSKEKILNSSSSNNNNLNFQKHGPNSSKPMGTYIPVLKKSITVKKNQILNKVDIYNIETKYNRNTSKNNQIEYLEPIQELKKNLSNHSLKFCSDKKKSASDKKMDNNKNDENTDEKYEKLKIDEDNQKKNVRDTKDMNSSNNKNTNISSSVNCTTKGDEIKNKKTKKIMFLD